MNREHLQGLKDDLSSLVRGLGAYDMRVAEGCSGFKYAIDGCHPRDAMAGCNSVIAFGVYVGSDYYRSMKMKASTMDEYRIMHLFRDWLQYRLTERLGERGYSAHVPRGFFDKKTLIADLSYKLAAYETGLGVYGKCGIIVTPEYGPRVNIGIVLTNAPIDPDSKLVKFDPCGKCRVCVDLCPVKAVNEDRRPPRSYDRGRCVDFILKLRETTGDRNFLCGCCYDACPVGKMAGKGFVLSRYRTLSGLEPQQRELLLKRLSNLSPRPLIDHTES